MGTGKWQLASRDSIPKCGGCQSKAQQSHSVNRGRRKGLGQGQRQKQGGGEVKAAAHRNEANPNQNLMRGTNGKRGRQGEGMEKGSGSCCDSCKKLRNFCATFVCYHRW